MTKQDPALPYANALSEVIKGLDRDPVLLFGIGAGIILVGALTITTNATLVVVVAAVLVAALIARLSVRVRRVHFDGASATLVGTRVKGSEVANNETGAGRTRFRGFGSRIEDSSVGNLKRGRTGRQP